MYICKLCGNESIKWTGQCIFCKEWNSLTEFREEKSINNLYGEKKEILNLDQIIKNKESSKRFISLSEELNNVLGGGLVKGSLVLISGEPGIGKSTLTLQIADLIQEEIVYISGEETVHQIASRANRIGINSKKLNILSESCIEDILESIKNTKAKILILDSISVMNSKNISGSSGSISQVKFISELMLKFAKKTQISIIIIGHITKDGNLAGPKTLEHMVDTVLYLQGEKYDNLRILRSLKNRFGNTSEIGIFQMQEDGLKDVKNPGLEFISSKDSLLGSSLSIVLEGSRAIIIETENLITYTKFGYPKRSARGINQSKLDLIIAVLGKYTSVKLDSYDVYSNIARGLKIEDPSIDLSIASSIISSKNNIFIAKDTIFVGEISLTGKIKKVQNYEKILKESSKLGFKKIVGNLPQDTKKIGDIEQINIGNIKDLPSFLSGENKINNSSEK